MFIADNYKLVNTTPCQRTARLLLASGDCAHLESYRASQWASFNENCHQLMLVVGLFHGSLAYPEASMDCMNIRKEAMIRAQ